MILRAQQIQRVTAGDCTTLLLPRAEAARHRPRSTIALQPGPQQRAVCRVTVVDVHELELRGLDDERSVGLGYDDLEDLMAAWVDLYGPWNENGRAAVLRVEIDRAEPARLLHRDSSRGYTARKFQALAAEPEAVDDETLAGARRAAQRVELDRYEVLLEQRRRQPPLERLRLALADAARREINVSNDLHAIGKRLTALERRVYRPADRATIE